MKSLWKIAILLLFWFQPELCSQSCLPEGIIFTSQNEVDSFQINYPNCHQIEGHIVISGQNITSLFGLRNIMAVEGNVIIRANPILRNLNGIGNLEMIRGSLIIGGWGSLSNAQLESLEGLDMLAYVEGDVIINYNPLLPKPEGLESLDSIGGNLQINDNKVMVSFEGLKNLKTVKGNSFIDSNPFLVNFYGLDKLARVGGDFYVTKNNGLYNFTGLEKLMEIDGSFYIGSQCTSCGNEGLKNLKGLNALRAVGEGLTIANNKKLSDISGLVNIDIEPLDQLIVMNNPQLSTCNFDFVCDFVSGSAGEIIISGNAPACENIDAVLEACNGSLVPETSLSPIVEVYPNPCKSLLNIKYNFNKKADAQVYIFDFAGNVVFEFKNEIAKNEDELVWNSENHPAGIYYLVMISEKSILTVKVIK